MSVTYNKLWYVLLGSNANKKDLQKRAKHTKYTMHNLGIYEAVMTYTLAKICRASNCTFYDVMEVLTKYK
jgi:putative transcriptional regulator